MARKHFHLAFGRLGAPLLEDDTTLVFESDPGFPSVSAPDVISITIGDFDDNDPATLETVHVQIYVEGQTSANILRAQEGTAQLNHASGTSWRHTTTATDIDLPLDEIATLTSSLGGVAADVTTLQGDVTTLQSDVTTLQSDVASKVNIDDGLTVARHASDNTLSRPSTGGIVYWIGDVAPDNAVEGDLWFDTTTGEVS